MTQIYICRHGNTFDKGDVVTRIGARTDIPLSVSGQQQTRALGDHFKDVKFTRAFCAPLQRTRQSAEAILSARFDSPNLIIEPFLEEIDYGPDENIPEQQVINRIGTPAMEAWEADAIPPDGWKVDPKKLTSSWKHFFARFEYSEKETILVMTSNGVARFVLDAVDIKMDDCPRKLRTASYGLVAILTNGKSALQSWDMRNES